MPAAVAIPLIYAGAQVTSTYLQNRAQNKAVDAQTAANTQAQQTQQQANTEAQQRIAATGAQQSALYSPYLNLGAGAASTLASRLGLPSGPAPGLVTPAATMPTSPGLRPGTLQPPTGNEPPPAPGSLEGMGNDRTRGNLAQIGTAVQRTAAQNQTQSGYVTMQSPDGETASIPAHQVPFFQAKGARVVS